MHYFCAIDIGGTYIKYALLGENEKIYQHSKVKTPKNINNNIMKQVKQIINYCSSNKKIKGIGVSTAGIVDREKGKVIYAGPTIQNYSGTDIKKELFNCYNVPVFVENDVKAALLGELWKGSVGFDKDNVFCLTIGTGIGGAYFNNELIDGDNLQANSIGYMLYDKKSKTNYEMRASTSALSSIIKKKYGDNTDIKDVFAYAKNGNVDCNLIIKNWSEEIAKGISNIILLLDPSYIIIGGGVSAQGDFLLKHIKDKIGAFLPKGFLKTEITIAKLANDAAIYGAVSPFFVKSK